MIAKNDVKWNKELQNDGALYFFQRIVEMLEFNTVDIYQCPIMNSHRLIKEYISVEQGDYKGNHLDEIYDEFLSSFQSDVAIIYGLGKEKNNEIVLTLNSEKENRTQLMNYLLHSIGVNYLSWIKSYILEIVPKNREKKKIEKAIRCLLPELFLYGYSREEIYYCAECIIQNNEIFCIENLKSFLERFDKIEQRYDVYVAIKDNLASFCRVLPEQLDVEFDDDGNFNKLVPWTNYTVVKIPNIDAIDAGVAAYQAYNRLTFFSSFYQFVGDISESLIQPTLLVCNNKLEFRNININYDKFKTEKIEDESSSGILSASIVSSLSDHARCSLPMIKKMLRLHNRAISNTWQENGFLNFWSILEMICVKKTTSKLMQVKTTLIPFLQYDYLVNLFADLRNNLKLVLSEQDFATLCETVEQETKREVIKIACLILLDDYSDELDSLIEKLTNYPVLRFRIMDLHNNFNTKKELFNLSKRYARRIDWHISRMYRARNSIVHAGISPVSLNELGIHLHAYVDSIMREILIKLSTTPYCHISNVLIDSHFKHNNICNSLQTNDKFDFESINLMLNEGEYYCPISID